ncbi:TetR/AcrR family transcriptional regulator [Rhodococcus globerulus]|uniref:TetR/AcrR family transcriptional regulator n=1 Tax=Rhodococcus globerulus TaxID=33008 RepID=UPI000A69D263|nr:TetR/AcrR family transcriptional regulator [Rhodococcus globerulus]
MAEESVPELTPKARRILESASKLFYEQGIHAVGVDTVALDAGVTKKTLYERFGSKDGLVVEYLKDRDRRWRAFRDKKLASAGDTRAEQLSAVFDASASWSKASGGKGCSMINAHAEFSDRSHQVFAVISEQKQEMMNLFRRILATEGHSDERLVESVMLLHEGALVADGIGIGTDPFGVGRDAALELLKNSG